MMMRKPHNAIILDTGTEHRYALTREGRVFNLTTGIERRLRPDHLIQIGGQLWNIKRAVARHFVSAPLLDHHVVRQFDPDGGIAARNLYVQTRAEFEAEMAPKREAALAKWRDKHARKPFEYIPRSDPARAAAIAKHEAKMAARRERTNA